MSPKILLLSLFILGCAPQVGNIEQKKIVPNDFVVDTNCTSQKASYFRNQKCILTEGQARVFFPGDPFYGRMDYNSTMLITIDSAEKVTLCTYRITSMDTTSEWPCVAHLTYLPKPNPWTGHLKFGWLFDQYGTDNYRYILFRNDSCVLIGIILGDMKRLSNP